MQLFTFVSALLLAAPMAMAAPSAETNVGQAETPKIDSLIKELVELVEEQEAESAIEARELQARQGWTCAFLGGDKGCQVKV